MWGIVSPQLTSPVSYFCCLLKCPLHTKLFPATKLMLFLLPHMLPSESNQLSGPPTTLILHSCAAISLSTYPVYISKWHLPNLRPLFIQYLFTEYLLDSKEMGLKKKDCRVWDYVYLIFVSIGHIVWFKVQVSLNICCINIYNMIL